MSLLDPDALGLGDAQEPKALQKGAEVHLLITNVVKGKWTDKNDSAVEHEYYRVVLDPMDEPFAKSMSHMLSLPDSNQSEKGRNGAKWALKCFIEGIEDFDATRPFDPVVDWKGKTIWAILGKTESDEWGEQNTVRKIVRRG